MDMVLHFFSEYLTSANMAQFVYVLNTIIALGIIFIDKKEPSATMAWIMVLYILPFLGLALYIIFSQNIARRKIYRMSREEQEATDFLLDYQIGEMQESYYLYPNRVTRKWNHLIRLNQSYASSFLTTDNDIELITDGKVMYHKLMQDIRRAEKKINICYFIIKDDAVGRKFIDLLTKKAEQGVEVRLLMDALGSKQITWFKLRKFRKAGGKYAFFFKPFIRHLFIRLNYRNHRKIAVIDDRIAYTGGFNIAKEYLGYKKKFGYWRDTHLRIRGDAVMSLNQRFYMDWRYASKEKFDLIDVAVMSAPDLNDEPGSTPAQVVSCGPESPKEEVKQGFLKMITYAKKNIYLQTPYLVPDRSMLDSLIMAAQSGVDVRIMIPCKPDHPFVYRTTLANAGELLNAGAKVYIYRNGFLHAKTLVVDGEVSSAGSTNFDIRSFKLNFESNVFIYDENFAAKMEEQFRKDMEKSVEYTMEDRYNISILESMLESVSRLLTEIL
jgi:cardiolipin synthase